MTTIRLPTDLPPRQLRRIAAELHAAARAAECAATDGERAAAEAEARRRRLRAALEARQTAKRRRMVQIARELLRAAPAASVAARAGVSVRTVERIRAELVHLVAAPGRL